MANAWGWCCRAFCEQFAATGDGRPARRGGRLRERGAACPGRGRRTVRTGRIAARAPHDFDFEFAGLVGLEDSVRRDVPATIGECRAAGIRVLMVTGEHPHTSMAIAKQRCNGPTANASTHACSTSAFRPWTLRARAPPMPAGFHPVRSPDRGDRYRHENDRIQALASGFEHHVFKPVQAAALVALLHGTAPSPAPR